ncbi:hypothetical protein AGMMS50230_19690 [Spirochaetia bacterium]|nr:hypothetical protein AGMMS50230_19690 [Spirochaetia bacterium]
MGRQIDTLKKEKPAVVVGNPGRLLQLARMGKLRLGGIQALVLDEGDRLVADEQREETEALLRFLPAARQNTACSATVSDKNRERLFPLLGTPALEEAKGEKAARDRQRFFPFPWGPGTKGFLPPKAGRKPAAEFP